jgi:hypothetical protein
MAWFELLLLFEGSLFEAGLVMVFSTSCECFFVWWTAGFGLAVGAGVLVVCGVVVCGVSVGGVASGAGAEAGRDVFVGAAGVVVAGAGAGAGA